MADQLHRFVTRGDIVGQVVDVAHRACIAHLLHVRPAGGGDTQAWLSEAVEPASPDRVRSTWEVLPGGVAPWQPWERHQQPALRPDLEIGGLIA